MKNDSRENNMRILASGNIGILSTWGAAMSGSKPITVASSLGDLMDKLPASNPACIVFDRQLTPKNLVKAIQQIRHANPQTRIVLLTEPGLRPSDEEDLALLRAGTRGFCSTTMNKDMIIKVLDAVEQGQLWVRRSLIPALLDEFSRQAKVDLDKSLVPAEDKPVKTGPDNQTAEQLSVLTQREREIAVMIGQGENNKNIANQLHISERTVKSHLTVIFRKLNLSSRVHLALLISQR